MCARACSRFTRLQQAARAGIAKRRAGVLRPFAIESSGGCGEGGGKRCHTQHLPRPFDACVFVFWLLGE